MEKTWELKDKKLHIYKQGAVRFWNKDMVLFTHGFIYCKDIWMNTPKEGPIKGGNLYVDEVIIHGVNYQDLAAGRKGNWIDDQNKEEYTKMWGFTITL